MNQNVTQNIERIYHQWNDALASKDIAALLKLYADDAVLESPLVAHLLQRESGILQGKADLSEILNILFRCQPAKRQFYRDCYFTDGKRLVWEYPRLTPNGEQMDFVEVMEIENNLIQKHRVYWGWYGVGVLKRDEHHTNL
ncbi:MAG: nuclear transport factor 2 family protein [Pseudomonadota bacterium]